MSAESEVHYEFDVFISYSSCDQEWVRGELLERIEEAGLKAFIDFRDFTRGAPSIKECKRGVIECRKTLPVLTPNYLESEWCEFEGVMAQTLSPANLDLRVIPLLKTDCKKPLRLGALTHIDFTDGADGDLAWRQLLTALGKPPEPEPPKAPQRDDWFLAHPYPMPPNFTGRAAERKMLSRWLDADNAQPLLSLRALGGFGKSALVWHWLKHDVAPAAWPRVVWWSFYERDASFESFLGKTLAYLGVEVGAGDKSLSLHEQVEKLARQLYEPGTLLVLDGFERELRAYGGLNAAYQGDDSQQVDNGRDCISPFAENFLRAVAMLPGIRSKILLTTRLCPRVLEARGGGLLEGCREEELTEMQPADAVAYFRAQGIRGTRAEIEAACEPYGRHPLSLCLLAGLIVGDFQQPGDIAVAQRLDVSDDLIQRQHHVLEVAYDSLALERRTLLSRIACFRGPVAYAALKALAEEEGQSAAALDASLHDLVARGLLHHDAKEGRFDLHPIVRRYAYDRFGAPDRDAAHVRLRDYFAAVPEPDKVTRLEDLAPAIELYHHTVRAGQYDEACNLFHDRIAVATYYQFGAYQLRIDLLRALFPDGDDRPPRLKKDSAQAWTLAALANSYSRSGQPRRAVPLFERHNVIYEKQGDAGKMNLAIGLGNVAYSQSGIGVLRAAEANLRRRTALSQEIENELNEAIGRQELGRLLTTRGAYAESETELAAALKILEKQAELQSQGIVWAYRAQRELLLQRSHPQSSIVNCKSTIDLARRALELADETARAHFPVLRDYVRAHWLLGAAHCAAGQFDEAGPRLDEALERCRRINLVEMEAEILIDLARLRAATGDLEEARRLAEEALVIAERCGYVLQGADAYLELAKLARSRGDEAAAQDHAQQALTLATCDGPPDYTYHAAYTEATALLNELEPDQT